MPEVVHRHLADDRDGCRMQELLNVGSGEGGADEDAAALVDDELAGAVDAVAEDVGAGHTTGGIAHDANVVVLLARLTLGEPDRRNLRIGERDARNAVARGPIALGMRRMTSAAIRAWYLPMWVSGARPLTSPTA